jgi:hypothetical protein
MEMAVTGGVERAAEQADATAPPVAERGGEREEAAAPRRFPQGRT